MNTNNVNTAAPEPSERCGFNTHNITPEQVYDLFLWVSTYGECTNTCELPEVSEGGEYIRVSLFGTDDTFSVVILGGWPIAASDEVIACSWSFAEKIIQ